MERTLLFFGLSFLIFSGSYAAEKTIWSGKVEASGQPTELITLVTHKKYKIKASGYVNLGKWIQNKETLADDACFEFSQSGHVTKLETLKNSSGIDICDGKYSPDHVYQTQPFEAKSNRIHFWITDHNYDDNSGALEVSIIELDN